MTEADELRLSTLEAEEDRRERAAGTAHVDDEDAGEPVDPFSLLSRAYADMHARTPDDAAAHFQYGRQFLQSAMLDEALAAFKEALRVAPKWADAYYYYGAALKNKGRLEEALRAFEKAVELDSTIFEALYERGLLRRKLRGVNGDEQGGGHV